MRRLSSFFWRACTTENPTPQIPLPNSFMPSRPATGKPNTQKIASGSRTNSRIRETVSWYSAPSRIAQLPSGHRDEHILERRMVRGERRQLGAALFDERQQGGKAVVHLAHGERDAIIARAHGFHPRQPWQLGEKPLVGLAVGERELDHV